ncbi:replication regulatory protein RepA, partial [Escherichia coli]|uniref:replication regulatory protein RepA n=1 Tax=Escherichia coli TaxID=562 RepID=UPI001E570B38
MSQKENAVTSSSGTKRTYRKGNPVPARERQRASLARRSNTHKAFHAVIQARLKDRLSEPRQPGGCKLKTAPVRPVVAARPAE